MFLTKAKFFHSLPRSLPVVKTINVSTPCFSTSNKRAWLNNENQSTKLVGKDVFSQNQAQLFTCRAEEETIEVEGVGWAGQPIVKRLHTILPEVNGDISDIYKATKRSKVISEVGKNLEIQIRNFGRSHDIIAAINESVRNKIKDNFNNNLTKSRILHSKKEQMYLQHSGILLRNPQKLKRRKRTVVLASKPAINKSMTKKKLHKKKKSQGQNKHVFKNSVRMQPGMVLNRHLSTMPLTKSCFLVVDKRFNMFSTSAHAKSANAVQVKKGKTNKSAAVPAISVDECVCPEILYTTGKRKSTKICGEAANGLKSKKKSSWKQKMCLVEAKEDPGRPKTFVCLSEQAKMGKRKKELPKCPEVEKKVAPRVIICAPNLIDEEQAKKEKKECVKIEEVKIRKRTQVCKPVILFAKEEVGVKVEKKAVCSSTGIKKVVSRHTKICPPS